MKKISIVFALLSISSNAISHEIKNLSSQVVQFSDLTSNVVHTLSPEASGYFSETINIASGFQFEGESIPTNKSDFQIITNDGTFSVYGSSWFALSRNYLPNLEKGVILVKDSQSYPNRLKIEAKFYPYGEVFPAVTSEILEADQLEQIPQVD